MLREILADLVRRAPAQGRNGASSPGLPAVVPSDHTFLRGTEGVNPRLRVSPPYKEEFDMGVIRGLARAVGGLLAGVVGLVGGLFQGLGRLVRRLV